MRNMPLSQVFIAQAAIKNIVQYLYSRYTRHARDYGVAALYGSIKAVENTAVQIGPAGQRIAHTSRMQRMGCAAAGLCSALMLAACAQAPSATALPHYLCELGIEFSAKFVDDTVALDGSRGYDVLFRADKNAAQAANPSYYSNPRMEVEFNQGRGGREATLRYPLLPLAVRCVRD
jgi:hypothetical protein